MLPSPVPDTSPLPPRPSGSHSIMKHQHRPRPPFDPAGPPPFPLVRPSIPRVPGTATRRLRRLPQRDRATVDGCDGPRFGRHPRSRPAARNHLPRSPPPRLAEARAGCGGLADGVVAGCQPAVARLTRPLALLSRTSSLAPLDVHPQASSMSVSCRRYTIWGSGLCTTNSRSGPAESSWTRRRVTSPHVSPRRPAASASTPTTSVTT
jgi:hypothetical protein